MDLRIHPRFTPFLIAFGLTIVFAAVGFAAIHNPGNFALNVAVVVVGLLLAFQTAYRAIASESRNLRTVRNAPKVAQDKQRDQSIFVLLAELIECIAIGLLVALIIQVEPSTTLIGFTFGCLIIRLLAIIPLTMMEPVALRYATE